MPPSMKKIFQLASFALIVLSNLACDPYRKKKCEWQIKPDFANADMATEGYATICLRNETNEREKCLYQLKIEMAQKLHGRFFKFDDVELSSENRPRTISQVKTCDPR